MSSAVSIKLQIPAVKPRQTMRGHTRQIEGVVHLPDGQRIITSSWDGSLRLWNLESGTQIGDDWRDEGTLGLVFSITLSPNGKTVASGSDDGIVRLWDVETGKVIAKWTGHTEYVRAVCWSADGERVVSGSEDGTAREWNVESGETILGPIKTGHKRVYGVSYSPDGLKIATGGFDESAVKIWDGKKGKLLITIKHDWGACLAWTSDGKKLISGSYRSIRIFDTATWKQIGTLEGHTWWVNLTLFQNDRLLASVSWDKTVRLWNLDTNLQVGPPIQHEDSVYCAAFSADGKALVTGCRDTNAYVWDVCAILKEAGLEDLLSIPHVAPRKSLMETTATRRPAQKYARRIPPGFFDDARDGQSSVHHRHDALAPSPTVLLGRLSSFLRHSPTITGEPTELQQRSTRTTCSNRGAHTVEVAAVRDKQALFVARQDRDKAKRTPRQQQQGQAQPSQTQPAIAASTSTTPLAPDTNIPSAATAQPLHIPLWARLVLFLCCASPPHSNGH